jgi:uncharacterized protein YraI
MRLLRLVCALAGLAVLPASAPAQSASARTTDRVALRDSPDSSATSLGILPAGTALRDTDCAEGWCSVTVGARRGWIARRFVDEAGVSASIAPEGRGYTNSDGRHIPSPRASTNGPPAGASAQCRDGTYSFSAHRRGTCSHHGGVARWL